MKKLDYQTCLKYFSLGVSVGLVVAWGPAALMEKNVRSAGLDPQVNEKVRASMKESGSTRGTVIPQHGREDRGRFPADLSKDPSLSPEERERHRIVKEAYTSGFILIEMNRDAEAETYLNRALSNSRVGDPYHEKILSSLNRLKTNKK